MTVSLITEMSPKWGGIREHRPGGLEPESSILHYTMWEVVQFKAYGFIFGIFYLLFLSPGWAQAESKSVVKGGTIVKVYWNTVRPAPYVWGCSFLASTSEISSCDNLQSQTIYYLALYKKLEAHCVKSRKTQTLHTMRPSIKSPPTRECLATQAALPTLKTVVNGDKNSFLP